MSYADTAFLLNGGLVDFEGSYDNTSIIIRGSSVTFHTSITIPALTLSYGTISSPDGTVVRANSMSWNGGTVSCSRFEVSSDAGDASLKMVSGSLVIGGFFDVSAQLFQCGSSVSVAVLSGAVFQSSTFGAISCAFSGQGTFSVGDGALQFTAKTLPDHLVVYGSFTLTQIVQVKTFTCFGNNIFVSQGTLVILEQSTINTTNFHLTTTIENKGKLFFQGAYFVGGSSSSIVNYGSIVMSETAFDPSVLQTMRINNTGTLEINGASIVSLPTVSNTGIILLSTTAAIQYTNNCGGNIILKNLTTLQLAGPAVVSSFISGNGTLQFNSTGAQLLNANVTLPTVYP